MEEFVVKIINNNVIVTDGNEIFEDLLGSNLCDFACLETDKLSTVDVEQFAEIIIEFEKQSRYFKFFYTKEIIKRIKEKDLKGLGELLVNLNTICKKASSDLYTCFDMENEEFKHLSAANRFFFYSIENNLSSKQYKISKFAFPTENNTFLFSTEEEIILSKTNPIDIDFHTLYTLDSVEDLIQLEITHMAVQDISLRKCKVCGKYFATERKYPLEYCDRPYSKNKTCRDIGAKLSYVKTLSDEALKKYETIYQAKYYQFKKNQNSEFMDWYDKAKAIRKLYKNGEIKKEEFLEKLDKLS